MVLLQKKKSLVFSAVVKESIFDVWIVFSSASIKLVVNFVVFHLINFFFYYYFFLFCEEDITSVGHYESGSICSKIKNNNYLNNEIEIIKLDQNKLANYTHSLNCWEIIYFIIVLKWWLKLLMEPENRNLRLCFARPIL